MRRTLRRASLLAWLALAAWAQAVPALDFRTIKVPGAVLYDGPSANARKLFILGGGYPVEILVSVEGWHKVRDATGSLAWVAADQLTEERLVMVNVPRASVRTAASDDAPVLYEAEQGVLLKVIETVPGWLKVRHRDGAAGFLRPAQAWGG